MRYGTSSARGRRKGRGRKVQPRFSPASSAAQGARLRNQLTAQEIGGGHAFEKHVVNRGEFPGITTRQQFAQDIERIINAPTTEVRHLSAGRTAFWDQATGTVVIRNPNAVDGGTAFRPPQGRQYFDKQVK